MHHKLSHTTALIVLTTAVQDRIREPGNGFAFPAPALAKKLNQQTAQVST